MISKLLSYSKKLLLAVVVLSCFCVSTKTQAAPNIFGNDGTGKSLTEKVAGGAGYNTAVSDTTLAETVGRVIGVILSIVGTLFFVLIFYAGYLWFMARGDEGEVEKAKNIIKMAVIGLIITLSAYTLSYFVVRMVSGATGGDNKVGTSGQQQQGSGPSIPGSDCVNGKKDNFETDVDCGGGSPACAKCTEGKSCIADADCVSGDCIANVCIKTAAPEGQCTNGVRDGEETDTDCGGMYCPACGNGRKCKVNSDCVSGVTCNTGICAGGPTCFDNIQNGSETDKDCGGGTCNKCEINERCKVNSDCRSGNCSGGLCKS